MAGRDRNQGRQAGLGFNAPPPPATCHHLLCYLLPSPLPSFFLPEFPNLLAWFLAPWREGVHGVACVTHPHPPFSMCLTFPMSACLVCPQSICQHACAAPGTTRAHISLLPHTAFAACGFLPPPLPAPSPRLPYPTLPRRSTTRTRTPAHLPLPSPRACCLRKTAAHACFTTHLYLFFTYTHTLPPAPFAAHTHAFPPPPPLSHAPVCGVWLGFIVSFCLFAFLHGSPARCIRSCLFVILVDFVCVGFRLLLHYPRCWLDWILLSHYTC